MPSVQWSEAVEILQPHVVRISTPGGSGSGFLISNGKINSVCGIATAAHVVDHAHYWEEPSALARIDPLWRALHNGSLLASVEESRSGSTT